MKVLKNNLYFSVVLFLCSLLIFFIDINSIDYVEIAFLINIFSNIIFLSILMSKKISSIIFFYIFNLIFFSIVPLIQYRSKVTIWSNYPFDQGDYLTGIALVFLFNFFVFISYILTPAYNLNKIKNTSFYIERLTFFKCLLICLSCLFMVFYYNDFNLLQLVFRGSFDSEFSYENANPLTSILYKLALLIPGFIFIRYYINGFKFKSFLFLFFTILCAFPLAIPRFLVAYIYFPILLCLFPKLRNSFFICSTIFFSMIFIFPFLNQFRYFDSETKIKLIPSVDSFNEGHFDAFQNFLEVVRLSYITYFEQLLGVFLFFIPRSLWDGKPYGSGYQLALDNFYIFNNISMPFIGEGFVNFGIIGIAFFSIIIGLIMKKIDTYYLSDFFLSKNIFLAYLGIFLCPALFFMFRGDLLSSFSNLLAGLISFYIVKKL